MIQTTISDKQGIEKVYTLLNNLELRKENVIKALYSLFTSNEQIGAFCVGELQKLWMKLLKHYKISFKEWTKQYPSINIHHFFLLQKGEKYLSLLRFYKSRSLHTWYDNAFIYGLVTMISCNNRALKHLELHYLSQLICNPDYNHLLNNTIIADYFLLKSSPKLIELFEDYRAFMSCPNLDNGSKLLFLLEKLNPQFQYNSKKTPLFYKELREFVLG